MIPIKTHRFVLLSLLLSCTFQPKPTTIVEAAPTETAPGTSILKLHKTTLSFDDKDLVLDSVYEVRSPLSKVPVKYRITEPEEGSYARPDVQIIVGEDSSAVETIYLDAQTFDIAFCEQTVFDHLLIYKTEFDECPSSSYTCLYGISKTHSTKLIDYKFVAPEGDEDEYYYTEEMNVYLPVKTAAGTMFQRLDFTHNETLLDENKPVFFQHPKYVGEDKLIVRKLSVKHAAHGGELDTMLNELKYYTLNGNGLGLLE